MIGAFIKALVSIAALTTVVAGVTPRASGQSEILTQYALWDSDGDSNARIRVSADKAIFLMPFLGYERWEMPIAKGGEWHTGNVARKTSYGANPPGSALDKLDKEAGHRVDGVSDRRGLRGKFDGTDLWIEGVVINDITSVWRGQQSSTRLERRYDLHLVLSSDGDCRVIKGRDVFFDHGTQPYRLEMNWSECRKIPVEP